jgi:hypothetical protein
MTIELYPSTLCFVIILYTSCSAYNKPGYSLGSLLVFYLCTRTGFVLSILLAILASTSYHSFWAHCPPTTLTLVVTTSPPSITFLAIPPHSYLLHCLDQVGRHPTYYCLVSLLFLSFDLPLYFRRTAALSLLLVH